MTDKEKENRVMRLVNAVKDRNEETSGCLTTTELGRPLGLTASGCTRNCAELGYCAIIGESIG